MLSRKKMRRKKGKVQNSIQSALILAICGALTICLLIGSKIAGVVEQNPVYAAAESEVSMSSLPSGIAGVLSVVSNAPANGKRIKRIGTSCEEVMVGQRVREVKSLASRMDVSTTMETTVNELDSKVMNLASSPKIMSDNDYENLLRIVEAEAGTEDIKGRVLIANVIMNRVRHSEFPDTITDVIWEVHNGVPQFSPTYDGSIYYVNVTDETKEAVRQAMEGSDYSEGALFFVQRSAADKKNMTWFDKNLKKLFKHGVHEFFTYPEEEKES